MRYFKGLKLSDDEKIARALKRSCKTDSKDDLDNISKMILGGCSLKEIRKTGFYEDKSGDKYQMIVFEDDESPKYYVRLKRLTEEQSLVRLV